MTSRSIKSTLIFSAFFLLLYFEPISAGPLTIAVIWKVFLLFWIVVFLIFRPKGTIVPALTFWGALFALQQIFNESLFLYPVETISLAVKQAYIPILYGFWIWHFGKSADGIQKAYHFLVLLSVFIVLSTIPFHLRLLQPISDGYDLLIFGVDGVGFVGVFQNSPVASLTLGTATVVLAFQIGNTSGARVRVIYAGLILIGGVSCALTLSRTGFMILMLGLLVMLLMSRKRVHVTFGGLMIVVAVAAGIYLFETSEVFRMRVLGINIFTADGGGSVEMLGSGRTMFWLGALNHFSNAHLIEQIFGFGPGVSMDRMFDEVGLRIHAHNAFIDALQFGGLVGAFFFSMMFMHLCLIVFRKGKPKELGPLAYAIFSAYVVQNLLQGERAFLNDVIFSLCIAIVRLSYIQSRHTAFLGAQSRHLVDRVEDEAIRF